MAICSTITLHGKIYDNILLHGRDAPISDIVCRYHINERLINEDIKYIRSNINEAPGTEISETSSRALHTVVAVPSSHSASKAAKNDVTDFLQEKKQHYYKINLHNRFIG